MNFNKSHKLQKDHQTKLGHGVATAVHGQGANPARAPQQDSARKCKERQRRARSVLDAIVCRQLALSRVPSWVLRIGRRVDQLLSQRRRASMEGSSLPLARSRTHRATPFRLVQTVPMRESPPPIPLTLTLTSMALLLGNWLLRPLPLSLLVYSRSHHHHHRHRHYHLRHRHHRHRRCHRHCLPAFGPYLQSTHAR